MNKLFVLIAVLVLLTGTAFAANLNDLQTAELVADTTGRYAISDSSVAFRIWHTDASLSAQVGISYNTAANALIIFYESNAPITDGSSRNMGTDGGGRIFTGVASGDTIGEIVDLINNDSNSDWHAAVGPDAWKSMPSNYLLQAGTASAGTSKINPTYVYVNQTGVNMVTCGIEAQDNTVNRIKSITHGVAGTGSLRVQVYDGNSIIYRKQITRTAYNSGSATTPSSVGASPDTINFAALTAGKGLAGKKGNSLVVAVSGDTTVPATTGASKIDESVVTITYDQVVK